MQITKNGIDTAAGPSDWFSGAVYVDTVATPSGASRLSASSVHFTPGAHTAWQYAPERPDDLRPRGRRPRAAARRPGRGDPARRPRVLRAGRGALARRRTCAVHDSPRDAPGRRGREQRDVGCARHRTGVRGGSRYRQLSLSSGRLPREHLGFVGALPRLPQDKAGKIRGCSYVRRWMSDMRS